jgi:hypothetical protein
MSEAKNKVEKYLKSSNQADNTIIDNVRAGEEIIIENIDIVRPRVFSHSVFGSLSINLIE